MTPAEYLRETAKAFWNDADALASQDPAEDFEPAVWASAYRAIAEHLRTAAEKVEALS